jgi:antitoxin component YwqK of YwqJK toxin-antitoxin module
LDQDYLWKSQNNEFLGYNYNIDSKTIKSQRSCLQPEPMDRSENSIFSRESDCVIKNKDILT